MKLANILEESIIQKVRSWLEDRQNRKIQAIWDKKSDDQIMDAYADAVDWLSTEEGSLGEKGFRLPKSLKDSLDLRLQKYIIPQIKKRGLETW